MYLQPFDDLHKHQNRLPFHQVYPCKYDLEFDSLSEWSNDDVIDGIVKDHAFTLEVKRTDGFIEAINPVSIKFRLSQSMPREVKHQGVPWSQVLHQPLESLQYILPGWGPVWLFLCKGSSQLEFLHPSLISSDFRMVLINHAGQMVFSL
nr:hypothetical protein Iba_chr04aCG16490 [Ipomoea batatas]